MCGTTENNTAKMRFATRDTITNTARLSPSEAGVKLSTLNTDKIRAITASAPRVSVMVRYMVSRPRR